MKQATAAMQASDQAHQKTADTLASSLDIAGTTLTSDEFDLFAELGRMRRVDAGQVLFRRGELGTTMFVIAQGSVDLDFGDDLVSKRLGPCEFFGELGLLVGPPEFLPHRMRGAVARASYCWRVMAGSAVG